MTRWVLPLLLGLVALAVWEALVADHQIPRFVLPAPSAIGQALVADFGSLMDSLGYTVRITLLALAAALVSGVVLAIGFARSRTLELALFPYAVVLQVTPVIAIAPLVLIWVGIDHVERALLIIAWLVAFFPILANMTLGLKSVDRGLVDLFRLYGASRWQRFRRLELPAALPHLLAGTKISGGLALIGAVVAEFVAGSGGSTGLAWRILEAGNRLQTEKMFAALILLAGLGIAIFYALTFLEWLLLHRWHESAVRRR